MELNIKSIILITSLVFANITQASDLAHLMLMQSSEIKSTADPQKRARMQKQFNSRMTPKFNQQMRNAQNNLHRSLTRMQKLIIGNRIPLANVEMVTFQTHLQRFERLAKAGTKLPQYSSSKFEIRISKGQGISRSYFVVKTTPNLSSISQKGSPIQSNLRTFLSKFGLLSKPKAFNSSIRTPPPNTNNAKTNTKPPALRVDDVLPPNKSSF